jgi:hypothetical protein
MKPFPASIRLQRIYIITSLHHRDLAIHQHGQKPFAELRE